MPNRIKEFRDAAGMSQQQLAERVGTTNQQISRLESGERRLTVEWMARIAPVFRVAPARLIDPPDEPIVSVPTVVDMPPPDQGDPLSFSRVITEGLVGERDLPVYAAAQGGPDGVLVVDQDPIRVVKRPAPLFDAPNGFGILITGDSMTPEFEHGDIALVNPHRPLARDKTCIFIRPERDGSQRVMIKRLVGWDMSAWRMKQFNPPLEWYALRAEWPLVHRVVGRYGAA